MEMLDDLFILGFYIMLLLGFFLVATAIEALINYFSRD